MRQSSLGTEALGAALLLVLRIFRVLRGLFVLAELRLVELLRLVDLVGAVVCGVGLHGRDVYPTVEIAVVKLYVCWGTFPVLWPRRGAPWRPAWHPCKRAHDALKEAGHDPEVVRVYGLASLPDITPGRRRIKRLTGESYVPVLVLDDGEWIAQSDAIVAWALAHPA